jgi:hypothetical protein
MSGTQEVGLAYSASEWNRWAGQISPASSNWSFRIMCISLIPVSVTAAEQKDCLLLIRVYPAIVGRFCDEIAARKMITDTITGVRIQASGVPTSRPQPTERRREGRTDPSVISAA